MLAITLSVASLFWSAAAAVLLVRGQGWLCALSLALASATAFALWLIERAGPSAAEALAILERLGKDEPPLEGEQVANGRVES